MKLKVYSFQDEMITEEDFSILFSSSYKCHEKPVQYILVKDSKNISGFSMLWLRDSENKIFIKREMGLKEANFVIENLLTENKTLKQELHDSNKELETCFTALISK